MPKCIKCDTYKRRTGFYTNPRCLCDRQQEGKWTCQRCMPVGWIQYMSMVQTSGEDEVKCKVCKTCNKWSLEYEK